jgi:hypothetical protein
MLGFLHQSAYGRPSLMLDLLEEFRPLIDTLVLRVINRRQVGEKDFEQRGEKTAEEILAESAPPGAAPAGDGDEGAEFPWDEPAERAVRRAADEPDPAAAACEPAAARLRVVPDGTGEDNTRREACGSSDGVPAVAAAGDGPSATPGEPVIGVYLNDVGRKVFLNELFRRLRERLYYPPRESTLELRDILRHQIYHLARVIEGKDDLYVPFAAD